MTVFRKSRVVAVAAGAAVVLAAGAVAVAVPDRAPAAPAAAPVAVAPYARAAAVVDAAGKLIRGKGVTSVQRKGVGEYCVNVSASGFNVTTAVILVSPNLSADRNSIIEVARSKQSVCGSSASSVLVRTAKGPARKNQAFTMIVV
ncbi:hypothetical protein OG349_13500 [Streptomyces sp. NBC_01317]|uniref:hypothetical protein n=1 Tax=Streptomyces sp. NBC_01317 TaxID=2903822 RepID=UPI002E0FF1DA|nr:hypothetical protein OG349_13500 [Streptomyces sp. NBC_01317]